MMTSSNTPISTRIQVTDTKRKATWVQVPLGTIPSVHAYVEPFTDDEAAVLSRFFTNVDRPVFALINLPEVVKGALFARYSRSAKSLRRLFLDEFVADPDAGIDAIVGGDGAGARHRPS